MTAPPRRKVSLAQVNFQLGPSELNSYHLPYTAGCLWAMAQGQPDIAQTFELNQLLWRREDIPSVAARMAQDTVVGFCSYVWNLRYNLALARRLRAINPQCMILFGGPEPAVSDPDIFQKHPEIDIIVRYEGELTFLELLRNLDSPESVPGLLLNRDGKVVDTGHSERIQDLAVLDSPYLTGVFDGIMQGHPEVKWAATLETNRGCPYACTFCDWGSLTLSKIKKFPEEKVFGELEWMAKHHIDFVQVADANFGIFPDRDQIIVEKFIEYQQQYGYPDNIHMSGFAKNQNRQVIDIVELLVKNTKRPTQGLKVSLQSLNEQTLQAIKRQNLRINNISEILQIGQDRNLPIGTELIMSLPGETLTSWCQNFWSLLEIGIHEDIDVYYCQVLENSELNLVQKHIYDIKTTCIYDYFSPHANDHNTDTQESIMVVTSTADMNFQALLDGSLMSWRIFTWHSGGYSNVLTRFLHKYTGLDYREIYEPLFDLAAQQPWYQYLQQDQLDRLQDWFTHGRCTIPSGIPGVNIYGNSIIFHTRMWLTLHPELEAAWFDLLDNYCERFNLPPGLQQDVMDLQRRQIVGRHRRYHYPEIAHYDHNVWQYINEPDTPLTKSPTKLRFDFPEPNMSDQEFTERIYWSRKRRFGRTWITFC